MLTMINVCTLSLYLSPRRPNTPRLLQETQIHSNAVGGDRKWKIKLFRVCYLFFFAILIADGQFQGLIVDFQLLSGQCRGLGLERP